MPSAFNYSPRHSSAVGSILDHMSFLMVYPWASILSKIVAYYTRTSQPMSWSCLLTERLLFAPILCMFLVLLCPLGILGFFFWVIACSCFPQKHFSYLQLSTDEQDCHHQDDGKKVVTLASANVLLANEFFCRLNNNRNPLLRSKSIGSKLLLQSPHFLANLVGGLASKEDSVISDLPDIDILCIQEVWERYWAATMIDHLRPKYSHFIHDVGDFGLQSNFCLFGSGLFVASKFPIEAIEFHPFQFRTHYAKCFSYGALCLKVRIQGNQVAYVTDVHGQAYQGKERVLYHQLSETVGAVNAFRLKTALPNDAVLFDSICGDFNFDNMSPGDEATQNHPIFHQYVDVCSKKPGVDHCWTVGTELRQQRMHDPAVSTPEKLRRVLIDDLKRRHYVLDADVVEHTLALASAEPLPNERGEILPESWGGKRRIDRVLVRRDSPAKVIGYAFSSTLAGLTDHIPVALSLQLFDQHPS